MKRRARTQRRPHDRRGAALAGAVLVMTVVNLAVISAVTAGSGDALVVSWRLHGLRATLAADSAAFIAHAESGAGRELQPGTTTLPGGEEVTIGVVDAGQVTVQGAASDARRQLVVQVGEEAEP